LGKEMYKYEVEGAQPRSVCVAATTLPHEYFQTRTTMTMSLKQCMQQTRCFIVVFCRVVTMVQIR